MSEEFVGSAVLFVLLMHVEHIMKHEEWNVVRFLYSVTSQRLQVSY
jgi:hypothetical protein